MSRVKLIAIAGIVVAVAVIVVSLVLLKKLSVPLPASPQVDMKKATADSYVNTESSRVVFNVFTATDTLYTSPKTGKAAATDFLNKTNFIPQTVAQNLKDGRSKDEPGKQHFYYYQTINSIPVYASSIAVHVKNGNQIYAAEGTVLKDQSVESEKLSVAAAKEIALKQARTEYPQESVAVGAAEKVILNTRLLGLNDDDKNYVALAVAVAGTTIGSEVDMIYFVDLNSGTILYSKSNTHTELQREVRNPSKCTNGKNAQSCALERNESAAPTGDADADKAYDFMGDVYQYYKKTFGQDSYDNHGGVITILPHIALPYHGGYTTDCRNAYWSIQQHYMAICDHMVANDVLAHEFTHGITAATANLEYMGQSGAINESMSDIMATGVDPDWNIGEDTALGTVRTMNNPPAQNFPDRLFSQLYVCPAAAGGVSKNTCVSSNDFCGVHKNSGILNKAFYLMVAGGSFNGCTMQGIGSDKAHAIVFRALTVYLSQTSNLKDVYASFVQACSELYDANICADMKKALQATELDQQPAGTQAGPRCSGTTGKAPACANQSSSTPPPSAPTAGVTSTAATSAPQPTKVVDLGGCKPKYKPDKNDCEQPTLYTPDGVEGPGPVTFTWCASKAQQGFNFRLDLNSDNPAQPDVVMDRIPQTSVTINVPKGKHAWWVHTFCADGKNGYLTTASGRTLEVKELSQKKVNLKTITVPSNTPTPVLSPTSMPGGAQQRVLQ